MIGERLKYLREDTGLTQKEMAEKLSINYRTYSGYERDEVEPGDDFIVKLCEYYNVSADYLLGMSEQPVPIRRGKEYVRLPHALSANGRRELERYISYLLSKENDK